MQIWTLFYNFFYLHIPVDCSINITQYIWEDRGGGGGGGGHKEDENKCEFAIPATHVRWQFISPAGSKVSGSIFLCDSPPPPLPQLSCDGSHPSNFSH